MGSLGILVLCRGKRGLMNECYIGIILPGKDLHLLMYLGPHWHKLFLQWGRAKYTILGDELLFLLVFKFQQNAIDMFNNFLKAI